MLTKNRRKKSAGRKTAKELSHGSLLCSKIEIVVVGWLLVISVGGGEEVAVNCELSTWLVIRVFTCNLSD